MIITGNLIAKRFQRVFAKPTRIEIQITGAAVIQIGKDQSEAVANNGIQLNSANTATPYGTWWQGELWYSSSVDQAQFVIVITTDF